MQQWGAFDHVPGTRVRAQMHDCGYLLVSTGFRHSVQALGSSRPRSTARPAHRAPTGGRDRRRRPDSLAPSGHCGLMEYSVSPMIMMSKVYLRPIRPIVQGAQRWSPHTASTVPVRTTPPGHDVGPIGQAEAALRFDERHRDPLYGLRPVPRGVGRLHRGQPQGCLVEDDQGRPDTNARQSSICCCPPDNDVPRCALFGVRNTWCGGEAGAIGASVRSRPAPGSPRRRADKMRRPSRRWANPSAATRSGAIGRCVDRGTHAARAERHQSAGGSGQCGHPPGTVGPEQRHDLADADLMLTPRSQARSHTPRACGHADIQKWRRVARPSGAVRAAGIAKSSSSSLPPPWAMRALMVMRYRVYGGDFGIAQTSPGRSGRD